MKPVPNVSRRLAHWAVELSWRTRKNNLRYSFSAKITKLFCSIRLFAAFDAFVENVITQVVKIRC